MEHVLTMANLKLKPFLFTPRPSIHDSIAMFKVSVLYPSSPPFNVDIHMFLLHSQCTINDNIERGAWIILQSVSRVLQKIVVYLHKIINIKISYANQIDRFFPKPL